ncbi:MAG: chemotaxis protein CheA [Chitinispirillaceae bacterium]|nr:chemotaxis protein CheA [Chitinispirillaceae bacterium]
MTNQFQKAFIDEAKEIIESLEKDLVALESDANDSDLINRIFRSLHTIKGSGAMFEFMRISNFAHELETLFDLVRNGKLSISSEIITLSLKSIDFLKDLLELPNGSKDNDALEQQLIDQIHLIVPSDRNTTTSGGKLPPENRNGERRKSSVYRIFFKPQKEIFLRGINTVLILKNLSKLGKMFCYTHESEIPVINEIDPELHYTFWTCILVTDRMVEEIQDVFIFVEGLCELEISEIIHDTEELESNTVPMIGEILLSKGDVTKKEIDVVREANKRFGEKAIELGVTSKDKVSSALFEQAAIKNVKKEVVTNIAGSTIRVQNERLDTLTNAVSELVTLQARLTQYAEVKRESELTTIAEYLEKLTLSLRDTVMVIRMVPVAEGFSSMYRLVRDLGRDLKKKVNLSIIGGDTELDKAVIDNLKDPMMHLIRNCVDHGLENPDERIMQGKPEIGQVTISAEHIGSHVIVSVTDDGKGLDADKIYSKAVAKGLIQGEEIMEETEMFQLIFLPGFSTAEKTTSVSGRGVGMDVVKRNIESIRGEVSLESKKGVSTTIKMKLPITLAIIDGLLFTVGEELFVVNISAVSECLELTPEIRKAAGEQNILRLRDAVVPYVSLRDLLNIPGSPPEHEQIIIMHTHDQTMGFVVDSVEGKHQTVVKTTGRLFSNVKEVTGATILGDGRIALILDVNTIAEKVNNNYLMLVKNSD